MEETITATTVDTQPEVEAAGTETATAQDDVTEPSDVATATTPATEADDNNVEAEPVHDEQLLTVKYDKKIHALSRDDATLYAQKGMRYDAIEPLLETLKYVATSEGKTLAEFVEAIRQQNEDNLFSSLMERCGDEDIAKELLEVEKGKHRKAYESLLEREKNEETETEEAVTKRMADEFGELRREFPQYSEFSKLPKAVVREAVEKGISLLDAQLRYEHRERVKVENAKADQASAAKASAGAQKSAGTETASPVEAALMKGLWG